MSYVGRRGEIALQNAQVVKLADARGLGPRGRKAVRVQVPPWAPNVTLSEMTAPREPFLNAHVASGGGGG